MDPTNKALYTNTDRRENLYALKQLGLDNDAIQSIKKQARSVACLVSSSLLRKKGEVYQLAPWTSTLTQSVEKNGASFGEAEAFRDELTPGFGSAFLVGEQLLMTAAHCVCESNSNQLNVKQIQATRVVFDFKMSKTKGCKREFSQDDIYEIDLVITHKFSRNQDWADWALIRLKREVMATAFSLTCLFLSMSDMAIRDSIDSGSSCPTIPKIFTASSLTYVSSSLRASANKGSVKYG